MSENQDKPQQTVVDVINTFSKPVYAQLELAESVASGSVLSAVTASYGLFTNLLQAIDEQYNKEMDEYDRLIEALEEKDKQLASLETSNGLLRMARDEVIGQVKLLESEKSDAVVLVAEMQASIDNLNARIRLNAQESDRVMRDAMKEIKRLKELNPDRMKEQLANTKTTLAEKQQDNNTLRSELNKFRADNASLKSKNAAMVSASTELSDRVEYLQDKLNRISGSVSPKYYESPNGRDLFYVNVFGWGLDTRALNPDCELLRGLDFHIEVRTNSGICLLVSIDQYGAPVFPTVPGFEKAWPEGLTPDIQAKIMEMLAPTHPEIVDRYDWSTTVDITELPIEAKHQDALISAGMANLFDIIHRTPEELEARVSGFGMATARKVRAKCLDIVKDWEKSRKREEKAA